MAINKAPVLSTTTIEKVHEIIGRDVIPLAGTLRVTCAGASGTAVRYTDPEDIRFQLDSLVSFVNEKLEVVVDDAFPTPFILRLLLRISTFFFAEFLKIHPFSNGNGRTARLLVSYFLLSRASAVPISLYLDGDRELFLRILGEAQWRQNPAPLTTFCLLSAQRTHFKAQYLLLTEEEDFLQL
jgi:Fic family protein